MVTQEHLKSILQYRPETGEFIWLERDAAQFGDRRACAAFNSRWAGNVAGTVRTMKSGYKAIFIRIGGYRGKNYAAHRLAFLYMTGHLPKEVDHINRDATDNRWDNLRKADRLRNCTNKSIQKNNTSGICGVYLHKHTGKYLARATVNGKTYSAGYHRNKSDAEAAVIKKRKELGFDDGHGSAPKTD